MYKNINDNIRYTLAVAGIFFITNSCRSTDADNNLSGNNLSGVSFNLTEGDFNEGNILSPQASLKTNTNSPSALRQEIVSGPFNISAELSSDTPTKLQAQASSTKGAMAVTKPLSLRGAVKYRIVAYHADGTYIDQAVGDASQTNQVFFGDKLTKGQTYNFVIYSLGSTTTAPPVAPTTNLYEYPKVNFKFTDYSVSAADLMMASEREITIQGTPGDTTPPTPITTPLKHLFTRINVSVDNSDAIGTQKGGYLSENPVNATLKPGFLYSESSLNLNTSMLQGITFDSGFITNDLSSAQSYIINTSGAYIGNAIIDITVPAGAIKVGNDVNPEPVNFRFNPVGSNFLQPGYSYTIKLRFNSDRYVNASNTTRNTGDTDALYAVIGGYRWDRYNLGATNLNPASNNPDRNPSVRELYGNQYQWGKIAKAADTYSGDGAIAGWNTATPAPDNAWNSGTPTKPVRTSNDPCASGTRVPSYIEFDKLVNNTKQTSIGTWVPYSPDPYVNSSGYTAAKVLTSNKNNDVKLTFPTTGWRDNLIGKQNSRGVYGNYWTSEIGANGGTYFRFLQNSFDHPSYPKNAGQTIRCIQDR
ncbi:fibrobacter succinogenes major paralogous domain-containing protein [Elizabethkingia anophelis]|uniref:hypothetical protein n=1 Tax=Elizabethkingia anophelis TaxID=1117645 RepID=UPI00389173CB